MQLESSVINKAINYIFDHIDENITVDDVASHCAYSKYHLMRLFKENTDEALYHFIKRIKLERSAWRLKVEKERSVTDIGIEYGYSSSNFATAFKKQLKVSPKAFRDNSEKLIKNSSFYRSNLSNDIDELSKLITIEYLYPMRCVYERRKGNYHELPSAWCCFLEKYSSLINDDTIFIECTIDDPTITPEDSCMYQLCFTISEDIHDDSLLTCVFEGGKYAIYHFKGFPQFMFMVYQNVFCNWLNKTGNVLDNRPIIDIYRLVREDGYMEIDICFPIK